MLNKLEEIKKIGAYALTIVFGEDIGTRTDIHGNGESKTGRINNLNTNLYSKKNEYSSGNLDSGPGFETTTNTPPA